MKRSYYRYLLALYALISISCRQPEATMATTNDYQAQGDSIIKATFDTLRNA